MYETCFFGWRGDAKVVKLPSNIILAPEQGGLHEHEKSVVALKHFFSMVVDETSLVLDMTCGSGTALLAAKELGARFFGIDKDPANVVTALRLLELVGPEEVDLADLGLLDAAQ